MIWITSDTHFSHKNICNSQISSWKSGWRDFASIEEMNDIIIDNINRVVMPDDTLYHLGDFAFGDKKEIPALRERINCKDIRLMFGNHDWDRHGKGWVQRFPEHLNLFNNPCNPYMYDEIKHNGCHIVMCHFPIMSWHKIGRGSIMLHGHCHNNLNYPFIGRIKDVGVDANKFMPLLLDDVVNDLCAIPIYSPDHHQGEE